MSGKSRGIRELLKFKGILMSLSNKTKIPYAFSINLNRLIGVDEVERGLACNCICPSCNMKLEARQGDNNIHHFSHYDKAKVDCQYSFWVSIRDLAKQILEESKNIQCSNTPEECDIYISYGDYYSLELYKKESLREKYGMDVFYSSSLGLVGIYFLTYENRTDNIEFSDDGGKYHILKIDLRPIDKAKDYTVDSLRDIIIFNPELKSFNNYSINHKAILDISSKYQRLYNSKSIMNANDFKAMEIAQIRINSFEQDDFSAINVAKLYYQNILEHFKNNEVQVDFKELHLDKVHGFYQYKNQYYATATIKEKYHIYQVIEGVIVLTGKCFKKDEIIQIIKAHVMKANNKNLELRDTITKYPSLF